jgi:hypothetical protein
MTTLRNRATPRQAAVMKMIEGAVRNAAHAHPGWNLTEKMARSISKRATGTLTSAWGSVLAAPQQRPSERRGGDYEAATPSRNVAVSVAAAGTGEPAGKGVRLSATGAPLVRLRGRLGAMAGSAKRAGQTERYEALVDALRALAEVMEA